MKNSAATVENNLEVSQKLNIELPYMTQQFHS